MGNVISIEEHFNKLKEKHHSKAMDLLNRMQKMRKDGCSVALLEPLLKAAIEELRLHSEYKKRLDNLLPKVVLYTGTEVAPPFYPENPYNQ